MLAALSPNINKEHRVKDRSQNPVRLDQRCKPFCGDCHLFFTGVYRCVHSKVLGLECIMPSTVSRKAYETIHEMNMKRGIQ